MIVYFKINVAATEASFSGQNIIEAFFLLPFLKQKSPKKQKKKQKKQSKNNATPSELRSNRRNRVPEHTYK